MSIGTTLWDKGYVKTIEDKLGYDYNELAKSEEHHILTATTVAAISRGKDGSNNPAKRFEHLKKEAAPDISLKTLLNNPSDLGKNAGRPLEFVPVILYCHIEEPNKIAIYKSTYDREPSKYIDISTYENLMRHSFTKPYENKENIRIIYTNLRAVINLDLPYGYIEDLKNEYFICEVKAPYFTFAQLRTHGLLSQVAVSERVTGEEDVWLPMDIEDRWKENYRTIVKTFNRALYPKEDANFNQILNFMKNLPVEEGSNLLKLLGYKKEIYQRWYNHLKYKTWIIGGWIDDPKGWGHFLLEREAFPELLNSWVQETTRETVQGIKKIILQWLAE